MHEVGTGREIQHRGLGAEIAASPCPWGAVHLPIVAPAGATAGWLATFGPPAAPYWQVSGMRLPSFLPYKGATAACAGFSGTLGSADFRTTEQVSDVRSFRILLSGGVHVFALL